MFHHLPPSVEGELITLVKALVRVPAPDCRVTGLINLGGGVAFKLQSDALSDIREQMADRFADCLTPQDRAAWRPHVTIQNKVKPDVARALLANLSTDFTPCGIAIAGLAVWRYLGGPWEPVGAWRFGTGHAMTPPSALRQLTGKQPLL
jgi:2'-5' RNA ligase superfamily